MRAYTELVRPPRSIFLDWPMGHPLGPPGRADIQRRVIQSAFETLTEAKGPGTIRDLPYRWMKWQDMGF